MLLKFLRIFYWICFRLFFSWERLGIKFNVEVKLYASFPTLFGRLQNRWRSVWSNYDLVLIFLIG